jgi:hypothetical protein
MAIRNTQDPYGGRTGLVDKLIGNAFDVVHLVARHINEITYLVNNMEAIIIVAKNLPDTSSVTKTATFGDRGETVAYSLPANVTMNNLVQSTMLILDGNGNAYQSSNGNVDFWYEDGVFCVRLADEAPASMIGATFRWNVTYRIR